MYFRQGGSSNSNSNEPVQCPQMAGSWFLTLSAYITGQSLDRFIACMNDTTKSNDVETNEG
jgi:hypothetical protein